MLNCAIVRYSTDNICQRSFSSYRIFGKKYLNLLSCNPISSNTCLFLKKNDLSSINNSSIYSQTNSINSITNKLIETLRNEYEQEKTANAETPSKLKKFLSSGIWKCDETVGDVNIVLTRQHSGKQITVEFQLVNPNLASEDGEDGENMSNEADEGETTDFSVTIENIIDDKSKELQVSEIQTGSGVTFYCTTVSGDKFRYLIGNVRVFNSSEEKHSVSSYNGPEYEGLAPQLQENLEHFLESYGINSELCDFIDEIAIDKETREYMNWLQSFIKFLQK